MKRFAVGYMNFFDNALTVEIVESENWKEACFKHSGLAGDETLVKESMADSPDDKEDFGQWCFDGDFQVDAVEIPES